MHFLVCIPLKVVKYRWPVCLFGRCILNELLNLFAKRLEIDDQSIHDIDTHSQEQRTCEIARAIETDRKVD
jgi:hypothetical protein